MEFTLENGNFKAALNIADLTPHISSHLPLIEKGGVISGSSALNVLHKTFNPGDIDIYLNKDEDIGDIIGDTEGWIVSRSYGDDQTDDTYIYAVYTQHSMLTYLQIIVTKLTRTEIIDNLQHYFDLDKCATRIYYDDNRQLMIATPADESLDPYSKRMYWNMDIFRKSLITKEQDRANKYVGRGFDVDLSVFPTYGTCGICYEATTTLMDCCAKSIHTKCLDKWSFCEPGEELKYKQLTCPMCTTFVSNKSRMLLCAIDFDKWGVVRCSVCRDYFATERSNTSCAQEIVGANNLPIVCYECIKRMNPDAIIPGQRFKCPKCNVVSEFRGGCQNLTCCVYGTDNCKANCDHGGYCGHRWVFSKSDRYLPRAGSLQ